LGYWSDLADLVAAAVVVGDGCAKKIEPRMNADKDVVDDPVGMVMAVVLGQAYGNALGYNALGG
jgi:hypothetical protein